MTLVTTPAVVLQTYRYSETSKVVRLATRDWGVQSAIAKGVLRPKSRFGAALESLSEGDAQLYFREARELQTLAAFDVTDLRRGLATGVARFGGASALAEVMLKMAPPAPLPAAYDTLVAGLDLLADAPAQAVEAAAVRGLWLLVAELGFAPALRSCVRDDAGVVGTDGGTIAFSTTEGGALCARCASRPPAPPAPPPARLAPEDYHVLLILNDPAAELPALDSPHAAAHRRLVARFIRHHLDREFLAALDLWERRPWASSLLSAPAAS